MEKIKSFIESSKQEKNNYIKELFSVRFVAFLKNYKQFKDLPKKSKIKHICFPIIVLIIIISIFSKSSGGAVKGLSQDEALAILACSALDSSMQQAAQYGTVNQVYIGSLSDLFEITDMNKEKNDDGTYKITLNCNYLAFNSSSKYSGTLVFKYYPDTKTAKWIGGTASNELRNWAIYYATK